MGGRKDNGCDVRGRERETELERGRLSGEGRWDVIKGVKWVEEEEQIWKGVN